MEGGFATQRKVNAWFKTGLLRAGGVDQVVGYLPGKCGSLSSNPRIANKQTTKNRTSVRKEERDICCLVRNQQFLM
jgi:hypothetical protein